MKTPGDGADVVVRLAKAAVARAAHEAEQLAEARLR